MPFSGNRDLQIGLRVRDWVRIRLFNSSFQAAHYHNTNPFHSVSYSLYLKPTWRTRALKTSPVQLKFENRTRTRSRTRSPIWRSLLTNALKKLGTDLGNGLKTIGAKAASALPGLIGAIGSFLFKAAGNAIGFLAEHTWILILAVVAFLFQKLIKKR